MSNSRHLLPAAAGLMLATGCGSDAEQRRVQAAATPTQGEPTAPPSPEAKPNDSTPNGAEWSSREALAAAIGGGHYTQALISGQPYQVEDPVLSKTWTLGPPELDGAEGEDPVVYPTSPTEGHAIARAEEEGTNTVVVLDYTLQWDAAVETLDGSSGKFKVTAVDVLQAGAEARFVYEQQGEFFERTPAPSGD